MCTRDWLRPSSSSIYSSSQKGTIQQILCLIYSRHEQDSCKANSNPNANIDVLASDLSSLWPHLSSQWKPNSYTSDQASVLTAAGDTVSSRPLKTDVSGLCHTNLLSSGMSWLFSAPWNTSYDTFMNPKNEWWVLRHKINRDAGSP